MERAGFGVGQGHFLQGTPTACRVSLARLRDLSLGDPALQAGAVGPEGTEEPAHRIHRLEDLGAQVCQEAGPGTVRNRKRGIRIRMLSRPASDAPALRKGP